MNGFVPAGFMTTRDALDQVITALFGEEVAELERLATIERNALAERMQGEINDPVRIALVTGGISQELQKDISALFERVENRLRQFLHEGAVSAVYFDADGKKTIAANFWATADADGVLTRGEYRPYGRPMRGSPYSAPVTSPMIKIAQLEAALQPKGAVVALISAERRCETWLQDHMTSSPSGTSKPKSGWKTEALETFTGLSGKGFDRAWAGAIVASGAVAWGGAGRKSRR